MKKQKVTREEYRKQVADKFIALLENNDEIPWYKGWDNPYGKPLSGATGKPYRGLNFMVLTMKTHEKEFTDNRWYTFNAVKKMNQGLLDKAKEKGEKIAWENQIHLKKDSKGTPIYDAYPIRGEYDEIDEEYKWERVPWKQFYEEHKNLPEGVEYRVGGRVVIVFNGSQIVNLPEKLKEQKELDNGYKEELLCAAIVDDLAEKMDVTLKHDPLGDRAYYNRSNDIVTLPPKKAFISEESYYATAIHELAHATGHEKRLNREMGNFFGSEEYAKEELVAEMTSAMMGLYAKEEWIDTQQMENHRAYIQSWIKAIKEKPEALEEAIRQAFEASDYLDERIDKELLKERAITIKELEENENAFYHLDEGIDEFMLEEPTYEQLLKEEVKFKEELLDPSELEQDKGYER